MRLFFVAFGVVLGLVSLGMVSCDPYYGQPGTEVGQSSGFFGTVLGLPKKIIVTIFRGIGAALRFVFVRIPEVILDVIKRVFYRVAHLFGKKDPYDLTTELSPGTNYNQVGYNQQASYKGYNPSPYNSYGNPMYRNPYGRKK